MNSGCNYEQKVNSVLNKICLDNCNNYNYGNNYYDKYST